MAPISTDVYYDMYDRDLPRIPDWTADLHHAELTLGIDTRGWDTLPVDIPA